MSISPTPAGKRYPCTDNPFRGPLNIELEQFRPRQGLSDDIYKNVIKLLYNRGMADELDIYVSIQDLLDAIFFHAVDTSHSLILQNPGLINLSHCFSPGPAVRCDASAFGIFPV